MRLREPDPVVLRFEESPLVKAKMQELEDMRKICGIEASLKNNLVVSTAQQREWIQNLYAVTERDSSYYRRGKMAAEVPVYSHVQELQDALKAKAFDPRDVRIMEKELSRALDRTRPDSVRWDERMWNPPLRREIQEYLHFTDLLEKNYAARSD